MRLEKGVILFDDTMTVVGNPKAVIFIDVGLY